MSQRNKENDTLLIFSEYPHLLMQHILNLLRSENRGRDYLVTDAFFQSFSMQYSEYEQEIKELRTAHEKNILNDFSDAKKVRGWRQRVFVQTALSLLLEDLCESEAVELLESLMWLFGWNCCMEIPREWEVEEKDKANFHNFQELEAYKKNNHIFESEMKKFVAEREKLESYEKKIKEEPDKENVRETVFPTKNSSPETNKKKTSSIKSSFSKQEKKKTDHLQKSPAKKGIIEELLYIEHASEDEYKKILQETAVPYKEYMDRKLIKEVLRAKRGNDSSQVTVADFYAENNTKHTDYPAAARWYSFAVRTGNDKAKFELGKLFDSEVLLKKSTEEQFTEARMEALRTKKYGIRFFMELAEKGYPTAQSILGMKYYFGDGVEKNTAKGVLWLKKAAKQGHKEAQKQLGEIYLNIDKDKAERWFAMARANTIS